MSFLAGAVAKVNRNFGAPLTTTFYSCGARVNLRGAFYTWSLHAFFLIRQLSDSEKTRCKCPQKRFRD